MKRKRGTLKETDKESLAAVPNFKRARSSQNMSSDGITDIAYVEDFR
jgi:hypothetical protein